MNDRLIILEALLLIEKGEGFGNQIIKDVLAKYIFLDRQNRSFIKRVLEGTLERKIELDYIINQFSKTPTVSMKPVILCILRMSVYQLKYMDQIPESAVCNEAVKLAEKKHFSKLKGFVNGVLRNIARNIDSIPYPKQPLPDSPDYNAELVKYLSITYSMPEFLVEHFLKNYGPDVDVVEGIFKAFFRDNIVTVRINESLTTEEELIKSVEESGAKLTKLPESPSAFILSDFDVLTNIKAFREGKITVQDQSAMLPVALAGIKAGDTVFDVCAAPGGKTLQAADKLCKLAQAVRDDDSSNDAEQKPVGRVFSFDVSPLKIYTIEENLERCDFGEAVEITVDVKDARELCKNYVNQADVLIADLPCSGLGIIGRKSDIKYNATTFGMESLVKLQREILTNVVQYVKSGGTLMYSTCTLNPDENEGQVKWMEEELGLRCEEMRCVLPSEYRDGFFVAKMLKS